MEEKVGTKWVCNQVKRRLRSPGVDERSGEALVETC